MKKLFSIVAISLGALIFVALFSEIYKTHVFQAIYILQMVVATIFMLYGFSYFNEKSSQIGKSSHNGISNVNNNSFHLGENIAMTEKSLTFFSKKPACFKTFNLEDATDIKSKWVSGPEFLSKYISCSCGNSLLNIYSSREGGLNLAPILLECGICHVNEEIFNPEIHGWDGENGDNCSLLGKAEPMLFNSTPSKIVVEYSYQGLENYEDLLEGGIQNPEDYFDVFSISTCNEYGKLEEVVSYECA